MATTTTLLTAEEFLAHDDGCFSELVRGKFVPMNMPGSRHGMICLKIGRLVGNYVEEHDLGRTFSNDSGMITERDPDTVRGRHISFFSYDRIPKGPVPVGYPSKPPEVVFEVLSPDDRASFVLQKVAEYLNAGVTAVYVVDPRTQQVSVYQEQQPVETFAGADRLTFPAPLEQLKIEVRRLFE